MHFGEPLDDDRFIALVRRAYNKGIRTFLTADVYGAGEADTLLGRALAGTPRDGYFLVGAIGHDFYHGQRDGAKGFPRFTSSALRKPREYTSYLARRPRSRWRDAAATDSIFSCCIILILPAIRPTRSGREWRSLRTLD